MAALARGYKALAWLGLLLNALAIPVVAFVLVRDPHLRVANLVLACTVGWPAAVIGVVACAGLLAERRWGVILAIVALSLTLAAGVPYGIVRLVLVTQGRALLSVLAPLLWTLNLLLLLYWCRPVHRRLRCVYRI
jgi:hypothetical protein